jgi:hypothetical protein
MKVENEKYAGGYNLSGSKNHNYNFRVMLKNKPCYIHRFFSKLLLGWIWIDDKQ